jgi:hypothetical protein
VFAALDNRGVLGASNCQQVVTAARLVGADKAAGTLASIPRRETAALAVTGAQVD